jgi:SAM-dependent methyltransferase
VQEQPKGLSQWQASPLGTALFEAEAELLGAALDDVFGHELLQLGDWDRSRRLLGRSRTRRQSVIGAGGPPADSDIVANLSALPVQSGIIDAVVLPHSLELAPDPYAVLREADRVLGAEGQLLLLGFRPLSAWGLRSAIGQVSFPPGLRRILSEHRVREWLVLLGYEITATERYLYVLPTVRAANRGLLRRGLLNPLPAGAYLIKARKRIYGLTPLRPRRAERRSVLGGLVEPST